MTHAPYVLGEVVCDKGGNLFRRTDRRGVRATQGAFEKIPGAPDALNTLNELATALAGKQALGAPTAVKTSAYTAAVRDIIPADASGGGFTITLPTAPADGEPVVVKKIDSTTNVVTVQRGGTDVFNVAGGATTLAITLQDQTVTLQYKASGGVWYVVGHGTPVAALDGRYAPLISVISAVTVGSLLIGHASDTVATRTAAGRIGINTDPILTVQSADTVFSKKIAPRVTSTTSASSLTPSGSTSGADLYAYTALAANLAINAPIGTATDGMVMRYRFKDNGTTRTLTWNAIFRAIGVTLPTATTAGKTVYITTVYNLAETVWDVIDVKTQA